MIEKTYNLIGQRYKCWWITYPKPLPYNICFEYKKIYSIMELDNV